MSKNRIYITGLWIIPGNVKRSKEHYDQLLDESLKLVKAQEVIFFYNQQLIKETVEKICSRYQIKLNPIPQKIHELPNSNLSQNIATNVTSFQPHPFNPLVADGTISKEVGLYAALNYLGNTTLNKKFSLMTQIYLSRPGLMRFATQLTEFRNSQEFVWFDASVSRFNSSRKNSDFTKWSLEPNKISHYESIMKFYGRTQPLNGSVLAGDRNAVTKLDKIFTEKIRQYSESGCNYPLDDEYIHMLCYHEKPELYNNVNHKPRTIIEKLAGKLIYSMRLYPFIKRAINDEQKIIRS